MVEMDMKFCVAKELSVMRRSTRWGLVSYLLAERPYGAGGLAFSTQTSTFIICLRVRQQVAVAGGKSRACPM